MQTDDLTAAQRAVLEFMVSHLESHHRLPTYSEISQQFHWRSANSAVTHVRMLEAKHYLTRVSGHLKLERHEVQVTSGNEAVS